MELFLKITNQDTHQTVSLRVISDAELTAAETQQINQYAQKIFEDFKEHSWDRVELNDLKSRFNVPAPVGGHYAMTIRKVNEASPVKALRRSCSTIYRNLVKKTRSFPLKFIWNILIAPFITVYRFLTQDRHLALQLHKIFGTEIGTQKQFLSQLKRAKQRVSQGKMEAEAPPSDVEKTLDEAYRFGKQILELSSAKNKTLQLIVDPIAKAITDKLATAIEDQVLGMIPVTLRIEDKKTPLMFSFRKGKEGVHLDIQGLPQEKGGLSDSYLIASDKAQEVIPHIVRTISGAFLADTAKSSKMKISARERIRLRNLELMGLEPFSKSASEMSKTAPSVWLNEMLCNFAAPLEPTEEEQGKKETDLLFETLHSLEQCFPASPSVDKVEWILASIEEEYKALLPIIHRLERPDQLYFFERLEDKMRLMQKRLSSFQAQGTESIFTAFFNRLEEVKKKRVELRQQIQESQRKLLSQGVTGQKKCTMKALIPELRGSNYKKTEGKDQQEQNTISQELLNQVEALKVSVSGKQKADALTQLEALHTAADELIEKKQYLLAQELALRTLSVLPVATGRSDSFWDMNTQSSDQYSKIMTALVKDVWESSLRLNVTYLQPEQLIQLFKAQTINCQLMENIPPTPSISRLDYEELEKVIFFHPHLRFGWKPEQVKELKQIKEFAERMKQTKPAGRWNSIRMDVSIKSLGDVRTEIQRDEGQYSEAKVLTDCARMQMMVSSLMKPDYSLAIFYGAGKMEQAKGLAWLDRLEGKAIANGAKTPEEIRNEIKFIRLREVQEKLRSLKRLELGTGMYVTEYRCVTIVDASSPDKPALAYLPNGYGLPTEYEAKYGTLANQKNTEPLVGYSRGQERFIGESDGDNLTPSYGGLKDSLSPQISYTEPTLLQSNMQKPPRGQVSQVENYLLEGSQLGQEDLIESTSVIEGLNILFSERNLSDPEVQKTVLLILTRSFLLEKALTDSPREMAAAAQQLSGLMAKKFQEPTVFPFLLQVGQIIKEHADSLSSLNNDAINHIAATIPCFTNPVTIQNQTQTGEKWLEAILKDPEKERSNAAIAYLYCLMDRPTATLSEESIGLALFSATFLGTVGDAIALPQFNRIVERWVNQTLLPELGKKFQERQYPLEKVFDKWMEQALPSESLSKPSPWQVSQVDPVTVENDRFRVILSTLQIISKETGQPVGVPKVTIPQQVQRAPIFLKLFGNAPLQAELTRDEDPNRFIYTFNFGKMNRSYRAVYDQTNGRVELFCKLPINPKKEKGAQEWFLYVPEFITGGAHTTLEECILQQGLWVNQKKPQNAYLFSGMPSEAQLDDLYHLTLRKDHSIRSAKSVKEGLSVALLSPEQTEKIVPFANGKQTLIFLSSWPFRKIKKVKSLDQKYSFIKTKKQQWECVNPRLGEGFEWVVDLTEQYKNAPEGSQEQRFFEQLGGDHQQFLLPLAQGKEKQFLLLPYEISYSVKQGLSFQKESLDPATNKIPLTLSFGKEGELKGSPTTFLYLAYYFCMKKDEARALFYLKKAKQVPAQSEQERISFERVASLFEQIPFHSFTSLVVQLKAQLAIRKIKRTQFSQTIYQREGEAEFIQNTAHVTKLYKLYRSKLKNVTPSQEEMKLKKEEEYLLDRIEWVSFDQFVEKQLEKDRAAKPVQQKPLQVNDQIFLNTKLEKRKLENFSKGILSSTVLLAADLDREFTDDELVRHGVPDAEFLVRHFFHFAKNILATSSPQKFLTYLLTIPSWQLQEPTTEDGKRIAAMAEELRTLLIFTSIKKQKAGNRDLNIQPFDLPYIAGIRKKLPYWGRDNITLLRFALNFYDLQKSTKQKTERDFEYIKEKAGDFIGLLDEYADKTVGEILETAPPKPPKQEESEGKGGVSMQTIWEYFKGLPKENYYFPLEVSEIPDLIEEEGGDKNKLRDMLTYFRESEARRFPILQLRGLSENMREIQKCEKVLAERGKERAQVPPLSVKIDPAELLRIKKTLTQESQPFSTLSNQDKQIRDQALDNLKDKCGAAKKYFDPAKADSPPAKEEYEQLCKGLESASDTIQNELNRKSTFTAEEIEALESYLKKHVVNSAEEPGALVELYLKKKRAFLEKLEGKDPKDLPKKLRNMLAKRDLYTDFDLIYATQKLYKDPAYASFFAASAAEFDQLITETLLLMTAYQQFKRAHELINSAPSQANAAKALEMLQTGLQLDRYLDDKGEMIEPLISRKCLVAEARAEIIYRPGQREIIRKTAQDPKQWLSLRMGLGKTSYAIPTIAEILAEQGKAVVITVPDKLLKSNRKDIDRATRMLFDQAGIEFSLPLAKDLPVNFLGEKLLQLEEVFKNKGYVITTVEELATLHDTCILLEEEKLQISERGAPPTKSDSTRLIEIEMRLHYYRKITRLLNGEATGLNLPNIFFGDETDETHHITHEVSIAIGQQCDPSKPVREVSRAIIQQVLSAKPGTPLDPLKIGLMNNTYPVMTEKDILNYMQTIAKEFLNSDGFLKLLDQKDAELIRGLNPDQWSAYLTGQSDTLPAGLPLAWKKEDAALTRTLTAIAATKQLLTSTFPNFLSQKSGNDLGLSDYMGFVVVPKITKNETEGMRYGDEFEMILAQYIGYLEFLPCMSLTDESTKFLNQALKTLREKSPAAYGELLADYHAKVEELRSKNQDIPELFEYLQWTEAYKHRWNILDNVVFDGGYIKRFKEQINTNVQEIFHGKPSGGVTGTLDPYVLPYISDEVLLHQKGGTSTREVEAETFLRMGLNLGNGLDQPTGEYADERALEAVNRILGDKETKGLINSSGATSEGMNTLTWIGTIRQTGNGKTRSFLFMHPTERIPYLWTNQSPQAVPYKGQALPDNTICTYAPSDVRGVDLPIRKGKVHMLASPTASPQELVQSLYRARQLGGDHTLMLHIPLSLKEKILNETKKNTVAYGDVVAYLVNRSIQMKLELNLKAQLMKVQFELKTAVTSYLKETNSDLDQHAFWTIDNLETIVRGALAQAALFKELRGFYIQSKEIDFEQCYAPREFVSGSRKVLDEYDSLRRKIKDLLQPIKEASLTSLGFLDQHKTMVAKFEERLKALSGAMRAAKEKEDLPIYQEFMKIGGLLMAIKGSSDVEKMFEDSAELQLILEELIVKFEALPKDKKGPHVDAVLEELKAFERLLTEPVYGKGKSHLYNTLRKIEKKIDSQVEAFNKNINAHEKYLPAKTASKRIGSAGSNEQVKELQQQKTKETEKVESDPSGMTGGSGGAHRSYRTFNLGNLLGTNPDHSLIKLGHSFPFNQWYMTPEVNDLLNVLTIFTGDPLVYIAVDRSGGAPRLTLISKADYCRLKSDWKNLPPSLTIYQPTPSGFRWVAGGSDYNAPIPPDLRRALMTIKAYLGYKDEFAGKTDEVLDWKASLNPGAEKAILDHIAAKGSPAQRKIFQKLLES